MLSNKLPSWIKAHHFSPEFLWFQLPDSVCCVCQLGWKALHYHSPLLMWTL